VYVAAGDDRDSLVAELARAFREWRVDGAPVLERVLRRTELSALGLASADAGDLVLVTATGYTFDFARTDRLVEPYRLYGMHGYLLASHPEMRAIYLAAGPGISPAKIAPLPNTAIAARVAAWLGIAPPRPAPRP
jgi:hypothetical protein